jgi:glyoxylase-like metal-dependent hydrolase (beta-lactamase superfamily II)
MSAVSRVFLAAGLVGLLSGCDYIEGFFGDVVKKASGGSVRLRVFDCGHFRITNLRSFSLFPYEVSVPELFVPCYLVEHPKGKLLWDAGLPPWILGKPEGVTVEDAYVMHYDTSLEDQLKAIRVRPKDITHVAFSHMHFDHVGSANLFTSSTLLIQKVEHQAAFLPEPTVEFFERSLYEDLETNKTVLLEGNRDVFGDGRVVIVSAPGHTPGHQVLFIDLAETGPIVLSGDLYHFPESRELRRVPEFNFDRGQTQETMDEIDAFLEKKKAKLWIQHDITFSESLKMSPKFYE